MTDVAGPSEAEDNLRMVRVVLCDDQAIVTEGLQVILSAASGIEIVGIGHDGAKAMELVEKYRPDVVIMDLRMPIINGIHATRQIRERFPATRVLILTTYDDDDWVFDAIRAGAAGYLLKDTPRDQIVTAIRGTAAGGTYVDPNVAGKLFRQLGQPGTAASVPTRLADTLSERELEILRLLADGLPNGEIAERLHLSKGTVQNYVSSIFSKLDVTDRTQAAVIALRHGLV